MDLPETLENRLNWTGSDVDIGFQRCSEIDRSESLYTRKQTVFSKA